MNVCGSVNVHCASDDGSIKIRAAANVKTVVGGIYCSTTCSLLQFRADMKQIEISFIQNDDAIVHSETYSHIV